MIDAKLFMSLCTCRGCTGGGVVSGRAGPEDVPQHNRFMCIRRVGVSLKKHHTFSPAPPKLFTFQTETEKVLLLGSRNDQLREGGLVFSRGGGGS